MLTLTPTKHTGATAQANEVTYVEPALAVTPADLTKQMGLKGVNGAFIADFLSACLTHERCGTHLYRSVAGRTANPVLKAKYEEFGAQTARHVEILEELITSAGGNPSYVSPLARLVETADSKALEATFLGAGGLDPMSAEMAMLDAVFMAETADHANWEALGQLAEMLPKGAVRDALAAAVADVEEQEDDHYTWARDTRARLTMLQASSSLVTTATAKAEDLVAQIKGWLGGGSGVGTVTAKQAPTGKPAPKKATAKKTGAKKTAAKKTAAKKTAANATREKRATTTAARSTTKATTKATKKASARKRAVKKK